MARGLNKVMIIGNLGKDPELKYTPQGTATCNFSVAVSRSRKDPDGNMIEETEWFRVIAWERLAETCNQYLHKGSKVYVEGRLQTRKWTDQGGVEHQMVEVVAQEMQMLDPKTQDGSNGSQPATAGAGAGAGTSKSKQNFDDLPF